MEKNFSLKCTIQNIVKYSLQNFTCTELILVKLVSVIVKHRKYNYIIYYFPFSFYTTFIYIYITKL